MANELQVFTSEEFGRVRSFWKDNEPWFVAKDVCDCLDIQNTTQAVGKLDADERAMFNIGRQGDANCINEYGLYNLVLSSRKPEAKSFKRWITHSVIPSLRKHGIYTMPDFLKKHGLPDFTNPTIAARAWADERELRVKAENKILADKPKTIFADAVATSQTSILVGDMAKLLRQNGVPIGRDRLFQFLRENGFLIKKGVSRNMPSQYSMENEWLEVVERTHENPDGSIYVSKTTKVTGKGQVFFTNLFLNKNPRRLVDRDTFGLIRTA